MFRDGHFDDGGKNYGSHAVTSSGPISTDAHADRRPASGVRSCVEARKGHWCAVHGRVARAELA